MDQWSLARRTLNVGGKGDVTEMASSGHTGPRMGPWEGAKSKTG